MPIKALHGTRCPSILQNRHLAMVGDSLTRYQYLSLMFFIENGTPPPRFGRPAPGKKCTHIDEYGQEQCSTQDKPNMCLEREFGSWSNFHRYIGGHDDGGPFHGRAECSCARPGGGSNDTEFIHYASEIKDEEHGKVQLTHINEIGWYLEPEPLKVLKFTGCSLNGTCRITQKDSEKMLQRSGNQEWDWSLPLKDALNSTLKEMLPDVDIVVYNRGMWNEMTTKMTQELMPLFYEWSGGDNGRCFYKSSTQSPRSFDRHYMRPKQEWDRVFVQTMLAGCMYLDFAHLTEMFGELAYIKSKLLNSENGKYNNWEEFDSTFWDEVHYMPWIYEELNNVMLNVLCNVK
jgi:hypothetical protein